MSSNYRISIQYHGQDHHIDLRADKTGSILVNGRRYSISGDDQSLVDLVLPIIRQNAASNIDAVAKALSSIGQASVISADVLLAARMDAHCKSLEKAGFTGSVLVEKEGKVLLAEGYGATNVEATTPCSIGSVSKQFTAAAIMQLVEQGIIQVDESINTCLPMELQSEKWEKVTIHHLLSHTSGIHNFTDIPNYGQQAPEMSIDEMLQEEKTRELEFLPGSKGKYSNTGYILLGKIIAHKSGISYNEYIETKLLQPAGMTSSQVQAEDSMMPNAKACKGHRYSADGVLLELENNATDFHMLYAAGGVISTVDDLARWSHVLNGERPDILSNASIKRMTTPTFNNAGYGLLNIDREGRRVLGHPGELAGFRSTFYVYPNEHAFITVLCNTENFEPEYVHHHLEKMALDDVRSCAEPIEDVERDYSSYKGTFHSTRFPAPPLTFALAKSGLPQLIRQEKALPTYPLSNGRLFVPSMGLELELTNKGTLMVYEGDQATNELVK